MRRAWSRLRAMLRGLVDGGARDQELSEELRAFVEHDAESKIRLGMTPEDARRAALIELGGAEQVKEHVRAARAGARWEDIFRDVRYAMRSLGHARAFSCSVIGNLSLGLAATVVAFAFINGALLRPFPGSRTSPDESLSRSSQVPSTGRRCGRSMVNDWCSSCPASAVMRCTGGVPMVPATPST